MQSYFGKLNEENVKNNFVLIYELLDGMHILQRVNFGHSDSNYSRQNVDLLLFFFNILVSASWI